MECVNLKTMFGKQYRVQHEESYFAERPERRQAEEVWLQIIPCQYGHIYPHGGETLAASVDGHPNVAGVLRRLKCCRVHQDGDFGELTVLFDVGDFDKVAEVMHPRRRRQVSEAERERLRTLGAKYRFQPGVQSEHTTRPCVATGQVDPEAVQTPTRRLSRRNSGLGEIGGHGVETPAIRAATAQSNSFEKQPK